ncbi:MAG: glycoside hydrolase family 127 protein, partial [Propionicimonas sp.]|nr:glycoside hydrolase family 127 protein [Propionicimonas sp.]
MSAVGRDVAQVGHATTPGPVGATQHGFCVPLDLGDVRIDPEGFLGTWQTRNADQTIPHVIANLETSGVLDNFRRVADGLEVPFAGMWFADSDLYKTVEAVAWETARRGERYASEFIESAVGLIERAQDASGYLNTHIQGSPDGRPWADLANSHELYCAGHLIQAAIALYRASDDDRLLRVAARFVERILADLAGR